MGKVHPRNGRQSAVNAPPLAGLRVVDWTHVLAGPFATYNLAVLGADVIRVERADEPDIIRGGALDPELADLELGEAFVMQSAGKRSLAIDARDPRVRAVLLTLVGKADVLVENFRPGKLRALGFDPQELIEKFPRLIVCSVSGYGQRGERAQRRAYDHVVQAMSGLMAANPDRTGRPQRIGLPIIDYATGLQAALAVLAAVRRRDQQLQEGTRIRGEWIDIAMHDVALTLTAPVYASHAVSGRERPSTAATAFSGNPLSGTFAASDGYIAIVCNTDAQSAAMLAAMRALDFPQEEILRLSGLVKERNVPAVHAWLEPVLLRRTASEWEHYLDSFQVPVACVLRPAQAYEASRTEAARWPTVELPSKDRRKVQVPGAGYSSTMPLTPELASPPLRGQHTREVLHEAGVDDAGIDTLFACGAAYERKR